MKATIEEKKQDFKYPFIGISELNNAIVYFTDEKIGIQLNTCEPHKAGHFSSNWNIKLFKPFNGKIILEND